MAGRTPFTFSEEKEVEKEDDFTRFADSLVEPDADGDDLARESRYKEKLTQFFLECKEKPKRVEGGVHSMDDLLKGNFIVCEAHDCLSSKQFLIENMINLKKAGFTTLFLEHLFYEDQNDLNTYCAPETSITAPIPASTFASLDTLDKSYLSKEDRRQPYTFKDVALAAKVAGIRIVAIDTEFEYKKYSKTKGAATKTGVNVRRQQSMNYVATQIIKHEIEDKKGEKWVAFMGEAHAKAQEGNLGVSELTGAKVVHIQDGTAATESLKCNAVVEIKPSPDKVLQIPCQIAIVNDPKKASARKSPQFHRVEILKEIEIFQKYMVDNKIVNPALERKLTEFITKAQLSLCKEDLIKIYRDIQIHLGDLSGHPVTNRMLAIINDQFSQWKKQDDMFKPPTVAPVPAVSGPPVVKHKA